MKVKKLLRSNILGSYDKYQINRKRSAEINKFKDEERVKILSSVELTDEQKKEIDDVFLKNYGEKIPYTWHKYFTAYTGQFDKYYFPELLFIPEFEHFINSETHYAKAFEDKNVLRLLAQSAGVKMPATVFSCSSGIIQDGERKITDLKSVCKLSGEYFIKPTVDTSSGVGCQVIRVNNGVDEITGKPLMTILSEKGINWVIQERLQCYSEIAKIYPNSVNTFRIMTYVWKNEISHVPIIMRIGQGGANVDNAHAGGMFIAVDDDGTLHKKAFTEFRKEFTEHPDTKLVYEGYKISLVPEVIKVAEKCHSLIPQIGCINWDFTINADGEPVLIEANICGGSIWLFQMAHGVGAFGERTPEILRWMKHNKSIKKSERYLYKYGNNYKKIFNIK